MIVHLLWTKNDLFISKFWWFSVNFLRTIFYTIQANVRSLQTLLEKKYFLNKSIFFKNKMSLNEIVSQLSHWTQWIVNLYLKSHTSCLFFILFLHVWIRICILNTDPYPQSSWIRIRIRLRIHNTVNNSDPDKQLLFLR